MEAALDLRRPLYDMNKLQMSSERQCGLGSLLPMSCRGRAEAFARRLHTRLRNLGTEQGVPHQRHPDSDAYYDFDVDGDYSPSSPPEVAADSEMDHIPVNGQIAHPDPESGCVLSSPVDNESPPSNSDSDANYYDLENDQEAGGTRGPVNSLKYQRLYEEHNQMNRNILNMNKLKLSLPGFNCESFIPYKSPSPERRSPIKTQPLARENGYADYGSLEKRDSFTNLYSPIKFEDCQRRNSTEKRPSEEREVSPKTSPKSLSPTVEQPSFSYSPEIIQDVDEPDFAKPVLTNGFCVQREESPVDDIIEIVCDKEEKEKHDEEIIQSTEENALESTNGTLEEDKREPDLLSVETVEVESKPVEEEAEVDDRPQRVRRCSSLRTGKTPPGTPGRKKIVRFADVLGLDLADIKTFMDDIPNIPKSAFEDLRDADLSSSSTESYTQNDVPAVVSDKCLKCLFTQPGEKSTFLDILNTKSVCLENAVVQDQGTLAICGAVRVRNLDFHKSVQIRYTLDDWRTFSDLQAAYVPNSCDGFSDRFQFLLYAHTLIPGQTLKFAVRFMCKGCQFWDNNGGDNYCFQCLPSSASNNNYYQAACISPADSWRASFF